MTAKLQPGPTDPAQTPPVHTPWGLVVLLGSLTAMGPVAIDMYLPSLPAIAAGLHATAGEAQATVSAFLAGMALGQLFYGPASDRLGRRPPILLGAVIYVAASVACALAVSPAMLIGGKQLGFLHNRYVSSAITINQLWGTIAQAFGYTSTDAPFAAPVAGFWAKPAA